MTLIFRPAPDQPMCTAHHGTDRDRYTYRRWQPTSLNSVGIARIVKRLRVASPYPVTEIVCALGLEEQFVGTLEGHERVTRS